MVALSEVQVGDTVRATLADDGVTIVREGVVGSVGQRLVTVAEDGSGYLGNDRYDFEILDRPKQYAAVGDVVTDTSELKRGTVIQGSAETTWYALWNECNNLFYSISGKSWTQHEVRGTVVVYVP